MYVTKGGKNARERESNLQHGPIIFQSSPGRGEPFLYVGIYRTPC